MQKKYSSLLGYINGVLIGTLIGFSIYSGVQLYSLRKEKSELVVEDNTKIRNLEKVLTKENTENEKEYILDSSKGKQKNPVSVDYSNEVKLNQSRSNDRYPSYDSMSMDINQN